MIVKIDLVRELNFKAIEGLTEKLIELVGGVSVEF